MQQAFSKAREIAHSALAVIAAIAGGQAMLLTFIANFGVHISALDFSQKIGLVGAGVLTLSKFIDSLNDIFTKGKVPAASIPGLVAQAVADALGAAQQQPAPRPQPASAFPVGT